MPGVFAPVGFDNFAGSCGFDLRANVTRVLGTNVAKENIGRTTGVPIGRYSYEQVELLREMAGRLLRQSPDYQRLLRDLGAAASPQ